MRWARAAWVAAAALVLSCQPRSAAYLSDSAPCDPVTEVRTLGRLVSPALAEVSGMVQSRTHPDVFWMHNDSGHPELLFAVSTSGKLLRRYQLASARCVDWEDIALGQERPGGPDVLFIADTGTNLSNRPRTNVYVLREPDPSIPDATENQVLRDTRAVSVRYADNKVRDVEAVMFDARDAALYFVTKTTTGWSEVYRAPIPLAEDIVLEKVATIATPNLGRRGSERITGGDISRDGSRILLRTYTHAYLWTRGPEQTVADALRAQACQPFLAPELQGEAIVLAPDAHGFFTVSEGVGRPIYFHNFGSHPGVR